MTKRSGVRCCDSSTIARCQSHARVRRLRRDIPLATLTVVAPNGSAAHDRASGSDHHMALPEALRQQVPAPTGSMRPAVRTAAVRNRSASTCRACTSSAGACAAASARGASGAHAGIPTSSQAATPGRSSSRFHARKSPTQAAGAGRRCRPGRASSERLADELDVVDCAFRDPFVVDVASARAQRECSGPKGARSSLHRPFRVCVEGRTGHVGVDGRRGMAGSR